MSPRWYVIDAAQRNVRKTASKGEKKVLMKEIIWFFKGFIKGVNGILRIIQLVEVGRIMPTQSNALVWLKRDLERFLNTTSNLKYNHGYNCSYQTHARIFSGMDLNLTNEVQLFKRQHAKLTRYFGFVLSSSQKSLQKSVNLP